MKRENTFLSCLLNLLLFSPFLFIFLILDPALLKAELTSEQTNAARIDQQQHVESIKKIKQKVFDEHRLQKKPAPKTFIQKFDFHYTVMEGLNQNVPLNHKDLKGSFYTRQEAAVGYMDHIKNIFIYRLSYDLHHTYYYDFSELNILDQKFNVETALKLFPHLFLEAGYRYDIFRRQHTAIANFNGNEIKVGLKHYLIKDKLYHKPSYIFHHRGYGKFKIRDSVGNHGSEDRMDILNAFDYEIGWYFHHRLLIRLHNRFGRNDSNDEFKNFHDYSFYVVNPIVSWHLTDKWLLVGGFHYQLNRYDDRRIYNAAEREHLFSSFAGVYYHINKYLTWGADCTYIQTNSNIPELEYKDPLYSTKINVHF